MPQNELDLLTSHLDRLEAKLDNLVSKEVLEIIISGYENRIKSLEDWRRGFWLAVLSTAATTSLLVVSMLTIASYFKR